ncbi:MAG: sensor histidine kinase [Rhodothermales bacterium]
MSGLRLPISVRLTFWYGLSLLIILSVFVVFLYTSFHVSLHRDFSEQMDRAQQLLRPVIQTETETPVLIPSSDIRSVAYQTDGAAGTYVRLLSPDGTVLYQSPNFDGHQDFRPSVPLIATEASFNHTWEGAPARSRYTPVHMQSGALRGWLEITRLESAIHRELHRLEWLLAVGVVLGVLVAIGSGYSPARRALRPVAMLTEAANDIRVTDLNHRLPTDFGMRDELTDLADTFNAMLGRLQASFERGRRFQADAAHEMFTPLSATQSEIDVALRRPREAAYYKQTLQTVRDHTRRVSGILDGLLRLSRAEAIEHSQARTVNLAELARQHLDYYASHAEAGQIALQHEVEPDAFVLADPGHVETLLANLIDNAIKYTPPGGTVRVSIRVDDETIELTVSDSGIGFDTTERAHLFDRFYRSDQPAVRQTHGSGLGLSIVKAIVDGYDGRIQAHSEGPGRGSTFIVRFPRLQTTR